MKRQTFKTTRENRRRLNDHLSRLRGYGIKRKSQWVREAIAQLLHEDRRLENVGLGSELERYEITDVVLLDDPAQEQLRELVRRYRATDPYGPGMVSEIIRSAIRYRMDREQGGDRPVITPPRRNISQ